MPAGVSRDITLRLERDAGSYVLVVSPDRNWLQSPQRQYPVTIDPDIAHIDDSLQTTLRFHGAEQECYLAGASQADSNFCFNFENILKVGWDGVKAYRSLLRFDIPNSFLKHTKVLEAKLSLHLKSQTGADPVLTDLYPVSRSWTTAATWNRYDGTNPWTTPGGDAGVHLSSTVLGTTGTRAELGVPAYALERWIDGVWANEGILVRRNVEGSATNVFKFSDSDASDSQKPYLDVTYAPHTGARPSSTFQQERLSDRMNLGVNVAGGNLLVSNEDLRFRGTGMDLELTRHYNSRLERNTDISEGWTLDAGRDIRLRYSLDGSGIFQGPSGYVVVFQKKFGGGFEAPVGFNADLVKNADGTSTITFKRSGLKLKFNNDSYGSLQSTTDLNDNRISYSYGTSGRLETITDTQGKLTQLSYTSGQLSTITSLSDGRIYRYAYDGQNRLSTYTDAEGKITRYGYPPEHGELDKITDPNGNVTLIGYDATVPDRVTSVNRLPDPLASASDGRKTTFVYGSGGQCVLDGVELQKTVVTDPVGNTSAALHDRETTYCYDDADRVVMTFDPKGVKRSGTYTPNGDIESHTAPGSETAGYNAEFSYNNDFSLTRVREPTTYGGATYNLDTSYDYNAGAGHPQARYWPSSETSTQLGKLDYGYDSQSNLTSVTAEPAYEGEPGVPGSRIQITPKPSGNPASVTVYRDADHPETTNYGYDDARGNNLTSITPPAPLGATTIGYDSSNRVSTVVDGRSQRRTTTYDDLDRRDIITFGDGSTIDYDYDLNGNTVLRTESALGVTRVTDYDYNAFNELEHEEFPDESSNAYTYDRAGNLETLTDAGGTMTYGYNERNELVSLKDPQNVETTFDYWQAGQRRHTYLPNGVTLENT